MEVHQEIDKREKNNFASTPEVEENLPTFTHVDDVVIKPQDENINEPEVEIVTLSVDDVINIALVAYNVYA